jgi:hypothetical protein
VYDATVKAPTGIEYGEVYQFGNFDQCMDVEVDYGTEQIDIKPKYCLARVEIPEFRVRHEVTRHHQVKILNF